MGRHEWTLYDSVSPSLNLPFSDGYIGRKNTFVVLCGVAQGGFSAAG